MNPHLLITDDKKWCGDWAILVLFAAFVLGATQSLDDPYTSRILLASQSLLTGEYVLPLI
ncbi:MAG: hypothetical protein WBF33_22540 [Candidatus Nitrosopolaris sp.]